jgi:hypothetical protein
MHPLSELLSHNEETFEDSGLLSHVRTVDIATTHYYTQNIDIAEAKQMVNRGAHVFYDIAARAAGEENLSTNEYLKKIAKAANNYVNSDDVHDRGFLFEVLQIICCDAEVTGEFVCLLGGKSTGKSKLLKSLSKGHDGRVFYVDLRKDKTISKGLLSVLTKLPQPETVGNIINEILKEIEIDVPRSDSTSNVKVTIKGVVDAQKGVSEFYKVRQIIEGVVKILRPITVIIDEANIAFKVNELTTNDEIENTRDVLQLLTALTKQDRQVRGLVYFLLISVLDAHYFPSLKINVILCSSEHAFPFRLKNPLLDFNIGDFSSFVVAAEVPPSAMWELLTQKWGIDEELARALLSRYGGHIYDTVNCLNDLSLSRKKFALWDGFRHVGVLNCLHWKGEDPEDQKRMRSCLRLLAENGFVPLDRHDDPVAKVISENNVGGVVLVGSAFDGIPEEAWIRPDGSEITFGLIPTKQSLRLLIASLI